MSLAAEMCTYAYIDRITLVCYQCTCYMSYIEVKAVEIVRREKADMGSYHQLSRSSGQPHNTSGGKNCSYSYD